MKLNKSLLAAMTAFALMLVWSPVNGATADEWEWQIAPYFFAPSLDLDSTVAGSTVGIDMSFSDVLDNFDVIGFAMRGEGWKKEWGIILDGTWTDLDGDFGPNESIGVTIDDKIVDLMAGYRINAEGLADKGLVFDIMPGIRYHYLKQKIYPGPAPSLGGSYDWVEPIIACRVVWAFAEKWSWFTRGDMSGFDIGAASKLTWSVVAGLDFQFAKQWDAKLAYRYYDIDYSRGSGSNEFGLDGSEYGVMLGMNYTF